MSYCALCDEDYDYEPPKPSLWERFKAKVVSTFQGPPGPPGPMGPKGDAGEPGFLQLSGFPEGTKIHLYGSVGQLLWHGELKR